MATAVASYLGSPQEIIKKTIKNFRGLEHRLEFVRKINIVGKEINFYNDSAATNPNAAAFAIRSFRNSLILISGGKSKVPSYKPLDQAIKNSRNVKAVILFGENKNKIKSVIATSNQKLVIRVVHNLNAAVKTAYQIAKKLVNSRAHQFITILLSPASASFDMFKNYADRGKKYKKAVRAL